MDARRTRSGNRHDAIKMFLCAIMIASLFFSSAAFADTLIVIEKETTSDTLLAGDPIIYRILYRVASLTEPAYNMKITDVLPPQVSGAAADVQLYGTTHTASAVYNASTRTATFTFISPLAAGSSGVLRVQTKYLPGSTPDGTTSENVATVTADNAPTVTTPPVPVTAISTFEMTAVKDITSGGNLDNQTTYRLRLRNPDLIGGLNFTNVVITDQLPAGAVYVASSNSGVYNPATHTVTWPPIATVSAGSSTDALTRTVTVVFPDSVFDVGNTILNSFTAIGVPLGQSQPDTLSALHSHTITANNAAMTIDKTVSATSQEVGKSITYYFTVNNSGNVPLDSLWISDVIPAQDSVTAILVREVNAANPGRVFYQTNTNATWTEVSGGPFSSMTTIPVSSLGLVPGTSITALRWTWPGAPFPFSGWSSPNRPGFTAVILATDRNSAAVVPGLIIPNVGQLSYQYNGSITNRSDTQNVTVAAPPTSEARPRTEKTRIGTDNIVPLSEVVYNIKVRNVSPATDSLINPVTADLLDARLDYKAGSWTVFNKPAGAPDPVFAALTNYDNSGRTLLRWSWTGASAYKLPPNQEINIRFTAIVKLGAADGALDNYSHIVQWDNPTVSTASAQATVADANDLDGDGNRTETIVQSARLRNTIFTVASMEADKWVKGELDAGYSKYPNSGETVPGGIADYRIVIRNNGNVALKNFSLIDILPHPDDTGVIDPSQRESEWRPNLMGEVDVPAGATVFYSQAGNPIRPEYSSAGTQSPNWSTTPPSDITQVRSIKIDFGARVLQPMEEMSLEWPMRAPAGAPTDGRIAWNSFGYLAVRNDNGDRLLPAEPVKVGISIKPGTGAIYGDRVWVDNNRNGIQDEGERGLNNIQVILKRPGPDGVAGTSDDIEVATANTADDAEGHPGYYLFPELPSGDYFAHFRPSSYWTVTGADNGTNDAVDSDVDSVTLITAITHLDNSEHDLSWDMGVYRVSSMIGNRVWQDVNRNGLQDDGEPGVAGVRVILHRSSDGAVVDSTLTANDGSYGFANLDPSNYYLQFRLPNDYLFTVQNAGGDDQLDSDVEPATGRTPSTSIAADEADLSWDAGVYKIPASIGNFIWEDLNVNGIQDPGEPGIAGVTLNLYDSHDALVASDTTDSSGYYGFTGVSPDTFYLQVVSKPSGYLASPVNQGTDDAKDSDAFIADGRMTMTELTPGENDLDWDAGFYRLAAFGDRIWRDDNKDGVQNDTEPGLANVRVFLHDSNDQAVDSTLTDENGYYTFDGLMPGAYNITVVKPDGFAFTTANVGGNDALDSDVAIDTGKSGTITLQSGDHQTGWDGGLYVLYVSLGDYVWHDLNRDGQQNVEEPGVPGVRVVLTSASDQVIAADTTDANGYYLFDQLPTGAYKVLFEKPAGHLFTTALSGSSATDSDADSTTGITAVITLAPASERRDIDAGLVALASIGDFVWLDLDADGLQDAGETGIPGVVVHLLNHDGDRVASDTTDASGYYRFTDLEPALYTIQVEPPAGLVVSPANAGTDEALDSDISGSLLQTAETRLSPGENDLHWDAGFFPLSAVGNYVWEDRNMDGVQDAGEKPWPNLEVRLLDSQQTLIRTAYTDSSGFYLFDQVMPGQYYVQFVMPPEEVLSPANAGSSEETDSDADVATGLTSLIDLTPGEIDLSWDAGLYGLVGVGNFVWYDLDQDGLQDSGEPGAPDVRINLYDSDRRFLQSMVTDQNGYYYFSLLPPGSYFLEFVAPPDYAFSPRIPLQYDTNSDADPLTGRTERITLRQGKDDVTWDAGLIRASAIGNYVWLDKNQDGVQDAGEPGLADVRVDLHNAAGQLTGSTQTDSSGVYWFEHLEAGSYTVRVVETTLPPGVVCTTENNPMAVSVEKGERYEDADFGYFLATASIGEYVWYDSNRDGSKQPTEQGLPNVVLILKDENGRVLGVTQTDEQGYYVFENLLNGRYYVQVDASSLPPTYYLTSGERVITIAVSEARYYPDANFGFAETELMGCGRRIIAWYEPWYGNAQQDSTLRHWNPLYRGGAADTSLFSLYDSREAKTWEYDILLAWASGIDGFVVDWFGKISYENTGLNGLLDTAEDLYQRFHGSGFDFQIICAYDELALGRLDTNFVYLADSLLEHPAYWGKRSGERRPVVTFDWRKPRYTHADYQAAADSLLPADVYLLHSDRADTAYVDSLKAGDLFYPWVQTLPTLWDIPFGLEWGKPYLEGFYRDAEARPETFRRVFSMGSVWPGFDDRPWQLGINRWISRQDTMVYHYTWEMAENTLSGHTWPWILVESWNDFNRATQIEPSTNWDYKHIVQTRDRAYRYKLGNANCAPEYIENLGLLVPQHIRQARLAAEKYPALATQIHAKTEEAVQRFFERDFLSAISLADEASGLSMEPFRVDAVTSHSVTLQWQPAERANGYVLYYTNEADRLQPCSYWRPDSILIGNATSYTLDSLQSNHKVYLALCAIDSVLGPHANTSWYTNNLKGIQPLSVQTLSDPEEPPAQADGLALFCVAGSPTFSGQGWDNAVDADLAGWDGTVTTRGDAQGTGSQQQTHQGPAWAIFSFSSDSLRRFNTVSIQTDNGIAEQYVRNRWASKLEVLVSETDTSATAFTSVLVFNRTSGNMTSFTLPDMVKARFVKLVIHQPNRTSGAWRQIVEFQVSLQTTMAKKLADDAIQPQAYALHQNYPNPFNPTTVIRYEIPDDQAVTIRVYDLSGRELETLVNGAQTAGSHEVVWNAAGYASGIYLYRIEAGSFSKLLRMLLIK